jgi:hypothetical protein
VRLAGIERLLDDVDTAVREADGDVERLELRRT